MRRIVSIWLPAWPIERMARDLPAAASRDLLGAEPFALVVAVRGALRIHAANASAQAGGVHAGQALSDARAVLPSLVTQPAEPERDRAALLALARWAGRYGLVRHADGEDGVWIDATGVAHLHGGEERLAGDIYARLSRIALTARIALAGTHGAAHALARYGTSAARPVRCVAATSGALADALAPLPVAALRIDRDAALLAGRLGLKRIGQLYRLPRASVARRFRSEAVAEALLARLDAALGHSNEPHGGLAEAPQRAVSRSFAEPLISADGLAHAVGELTHEMQALLGAQGVGLRRARLRLSRADGSAVEIVIGTAAPVVAAEHLLDLIASRLDAVDAGFGIDAAQLTALAVEPLEARQTTLRGVAGQRGVRTSTDPADVFADPGERQAALSRLADRLANRLGSDRVVVLAVAPRHLPEHAQVVRPLLRQRSQTGALLGRVPGGRADAADDAAFTASHARGPRPALLLDRPEPIAVMAEVPDGPPLRFTWRRVEHRVAAAQGPERIAPAWWRSLPRPSTQADEAGARASGDDPAAAALGERVPSSGPRTRDYYIVEDQAGGRYWVFRAGLYGRGENGEEAGEHASPAWFLHGVFA